jgi:hypothetical protein
MENPHYETGSQDLVVISSAESQVRIPSHPSLKKTRKNTILKIISDSANHLAMHKVR